MSVHIEATIDIVLTYTVDGCILFQHMDNTNRSSGNSFYFQRNGEKTLFMDFLACIAKGVDSRLKKIYLPRCLFTDHHSYYEYDGSTITELYFSNGEITSYKDSSPLKTKLVSKITAFHMIYIKDFLDKIGYPSVSANRDSIKQIE